MFCFMAASSAIVMAVTTNTKVFLPFTMIFIGLAVVFSIVGFFINLAQWDIQIKRFEEVRKSKKLLKIKRKQFEELKADWIKYLSVEYPDFEKDVFSKMSPQEKTDLKMYFTKYPELSTSSMFNLLVEKISRMSNEIYNLDSELETHSAIIRSQFQNQWLLIKPPIPEDIKGMVYRLPDSEEEK